MDNGVGTAPGSDAVGYPITPVDAVGDPKFPARPVWLTTLSPGGEFSRGVTPGVVPDGSARRHKRFPSPALNLPMKTRSRVVVNDRGSPLDGPSHRSASRRAPDPVVLHSSLPWLAVIAVKYSRFFHTVTSEIADDGGPSLMSLTMDRVWPYARFATESAAKKVACFMVVVTVSWFDL